MLSAGHSVLLSSLSGNCNGFYKELIRLTAYVTL